LVKNAINRQGGWRKDPSSETVAASAGCGRWGDAKSGNWRFRRERKGRSPLEKKTTGHCLPGENFQYWNLGERFPRKRRYVAPLNLRLEWRINFSPKGGDKTAAEDGVPRFQRRKRG